MSDTARPPGPLQLLVNGIIHENPVFRLALSLCPAVAVTTTVNPLKGVSAKANNAPFCSMNQAKAASAHCAGSWMRRTPLHGSLSRLLSVAISMPPAMTSGHRRRP